MAHHPDGMCVGAVVTGQTREDGSLVLRYWEGGGDKLEHRSCSCLQD